MKKVIVILAAIVVFSTIIFLLNKTSENKEIYMYSNNSKVFITDKKENKEIIISNNYNGEKIKKTKANISDDKIIFISNYTYDNNYTLKYIYTKDIFQSSYAKVHDLANDVTNHTIINSSVVYLSNETLYKFANKKEVISSNVKKLMPGDTSSYYLMNNGVVNKIDESLKITEQFTDVIDVLDIKDEELIYTKRTDITKLGLYIKNLYIGPKLVTNSLYNYKGIDNNKIAYEELNNDILKEIKEDTIIGFKNEIKSIDESIKTNDKIIYMVGSYTCGHCQILAPIMEQLSQEIGFVLNYLDYPTIEVSEQSKINNIYEIMSFPTLLITDDNNKLLDYRIGSASKEIIKEFILKNIESNKVLDINFSDYIVIKTF